MKGVEDAAMLIGMVTPADDRFDLGPGSDDCRYRGRFLVPISVRLDRHSRQAKPKIQDNFHYQDFF